MQKVAPIPQNQEQENQLLDKNHLDSVTFFLKLKQKDRHFQEQIEKEQKKDWNFAGDKGVIVIHNLHINNKRAKFI